MFTELNQELKRVKDNIRLKKKWEGHLQRAESLLREERTKFRQYEALLRKEKKDVERLESFSLTNILTTLGGRKHEKLREEKREVAAAEFKLQEAEKTVYDLEVEMEEYRNLIGELRGVDAEYREILLEKERLIKDSSTVWTEELFDLVEEEANLQSMLNEYEEAISAGKMASAGLGEAIKSLETAKGWSTFDMFGGGMITTAIKHSNIDAAKDDIHRVQNQLRHFQEELLDIKNHFEIDLEIGGMLTFADYFFDGLLVDWMVHGKITDSLEQTSRMQTRVDDMMRKLERDYKQLQQQTNDIGKQRIALLENA